MEAQTNKELENWEESLILLEKIAEQVGFKPELNPKPIEAK